MRIVYRTRSVRLTVQPPDGPGIQVENMEGGEGLRMSFEITRTLSPAMDEGTVTVYNLGPDQIGVIESQRGQPGTLQDLTTYGEPTLPYGSFRPTEVASALSDNLSIVTLEAGYNGTVSTIFESITGRVVSDKPDNITTVTRITALDNLDGALFGNANQTFPPGAPLYGVVDALRRVLGLGKGNFSLPTWTALIGAPVLDTPYTVNGDAAKQLDSVFEYLRSTDNKANVRWFQDGGDFGIYRDDGFVTGDPVSLPPLKTRPTRESSGAIAVSCYLAPLVRPGRLVLLTPGGASAQTGDLPSPEGILRADVPPGLYRCDTVRHVGDTDPRGVFTTTVTLYPNPFPG